MLQKQPFNTIDANECNKLYCYTNDIKHKQVLFRILIFKNVALSLQINLQFNK